MARRNPSKKAEWTLFSIKGLATVAGLIWAYSAYQKKTKAAEAAERAALAQQKAAEDPVGTATESLMRRFQG